MPRMESLGKAILSRLKQKTKVSVISMSTMNVILCPKSATGVTIPAVSREMLLNFVFHSLENIPERSIELVEETIEAGIPMYLGNNVQPIYSILEENEDSFL